jgi:septal ring factor EnvC (AmiA/AmiB activator)
LSTSRDKYTLVLFRSGSGVHRKITLPVPLVKKLLWLLVPGFCALMLGAVVAITLYLVNLDNINNYARLARQKQELEKQLGFFSRRMDDLKTQLTGLQESSARVKVMANLAVVPGPDEKRGVGGPDPLAAELTVSCLDAERKQQLARMHEELQSLEVGISREESELERLSDHLREQQTLLNFTPSVWPVRGWISSRYGYRVSPFTQHRELHKGIDIVNRAGTPVVATADGRVAFAGNRRGYGKMVIIDHGLGRVTKYGHLSRITVNNGEEVVRGQKIGLLGSTGRSTGPHLHYEVVVNGQAVDPMDYLLD